MARVVVIDDQRDVALAVDFALRALGHEVRIAHDALGGLRAVIEFEPHWVFIDLIMPIVDGWELARSIRSLQLPSPPRLVAMSGFATAADRERSQAEGFEQHLAKPLSITDLANIVDRTN